MRAHRRATVGGFLLAFCVAALGGCAVGPDYQPSAVVVPTVFGPPKQVSQAEPSIQWWRSLHDPELDRLIERAVECNPDLDIALARVQAYRTQEIVVMSEALPTVGASAGIAAGTGTDLTKGRVAQSIRAGDSTRGLNNLDKAGGLDALWELDLFGKYSRLFEAARDDAQAMYELRNAILISVVASVAQSYVEVRGLQLRLRILREAIRTAKKSVGFVQARFDQGLTNELDLTLAKRELATVEAGLPIFTADISLAQSRLAVLLGTYSAEIVPELGASARLPHPPSRLKTGVPADLLMRRPDIRQAERAVAAATARIGAATAELFPSVVFTAGFGAQDGVPTPNSTTPKLKNPIWSAGPGAYWPLLDFGRLDALIDIQELQAHEQLVGYKATVLAAVEEVNEAIRQYRAQLQRLRDLSIALAQARRAVDLATERYERGLTDFLNVLDAERQEFLIEDQNAVAQIAVVSQYILLYKALGGGWELYGELPPLKPVQPAAAAMIRRLANDWR